MSLKSEKLVLLTCAAFVLTSLSFQSDALAANETVVSPQQTVVKPSLDPAQVDRPIECDGLTNEECEKLEIDTNEVFEVVPG